MIKTFALLSGVILTCIAGQAAAAEKAELPADLRFGHVSYPAPGNVQLDEGTAEMYIRIQTDISRPFPYATSIGSFLELLQTTTGEKAVVTLVTNGMKICMIAYVKPMSQTWVPCSEKNKPGRSWKDGEDHVIAFAWKGRERQIFIDGVPGPLVEVEGPLTLDLSSTIIRLGAGCSFFAMDELRISSIRRSAEELQAGVDQAPKADAFTLLLDHFDEKPAVLAGNDNDQARQAEGVVAIDARFGKALQFWTGTKP